MREATPSLVVFDLDDTLYEYAPCDEAGRTALEAWAAAELGVSTSRFAEVFAQARTRVKARLGRTASSHSRLLYIHETLELLGLRSEPRLALEMEQTYWRSYLGVSELRDGAMDLLEALKYNGIPIAIVTDLTAQIQFRKLVYLDIARFIDHVVCSEETVGEKESLAPFELLADRVDAAALRNVWFIGDQPFDAPVSALIERGIIESGLGFIAAPHPSAAGSHTKRWDRMAEIERALNESTSGRAS